MSVKNIHSLDPLPIRWQLALCLFAAWTIIGLILWKGLASYGKAAYVITLSPYFVLTALLIYTAQLEGAADGIKFYLEPEWDKLSDLDVWTTAASQILFSLTVGLGSQGGGSIELFWPEKRPQYWPKKWPEVPFEKDACIEFIF